MLYKRAAIATLVIVLPITILAVKWELLIRDLENRFPDLDPIKIRKAYVQFMKRSLLDNFEVDIVGLDDHEMDQLFLLEYDNLK